MPELGPYVSLGITIVNVVMTFPPIFLIEVCIPLCFLVSLILRGHSQRMGRKQLLTISSLGALGSLVCVGFGLNSGFTGLASVAVLAFIA